jgi:hypothetical protein
MRYSYPKLKDGEFRVLVLHPGLENSDLTGSLVHRRWDTDGSLMPFRITTKLLPGIVIHLGKARQFRASS